MIVLKFIGLFVLLSIIIIFISVYIVANMFRNRGSIATRMFFAFIRATPVKVVGMIVSIWNKDKGNKIILKASDMLDPFEVFDNDYLLTDKDMEDRE